MTSRRRPIPADMLLLQERRRRLLGPPSPQRDLADAGTVSEEIFVSDEDQLIETESGDALVPTAEASGDVLLRRPIAHVSLAKVGWSGPIDHEALQEAVLCYPADVRYARAPAVFFLEQPAWANEGDVALEVTLRAGDVEVLSSLASAGGRLSTASIIRAARLPERLVGAEGPTRQAMAAVLVAYRRASLGFAWHDHLSKRQSVQLHRERDEAAVAILSTLRALLGER